MWNTNVHSAVEEDTSSYVPFKMIQMDTEYFEYGKKHQAVNS